MCGRVRCTLSPSQAARAFGFPTRTCAAGSTIARGGGGGDVIPTVPTLQMDRYRPSYNVSPGAYLPVGTMRPLPAGCDGGGGVDREVPVIQCMKWGLVPSFTGKNEKPDHFRIFNARSESIKEKASFRRLISYNRCLVAVEGFYEWKKDGSKKVPYYIHFQDQKPLVFAALFDTSTNSEGETINTFTILTTRASTSLKWLHDRMPVILGDEYSINTWLNSASLKLEEITVPYEGADLVWYPVTAAIGKTSFDGPECMKEVQMRPNENPISTFFARKPVKLEKIDQDFAETKALRAAKEECYETAENQLEKTYQAQMEEKQDASTIVDQPITLEHDVEKAETMKHDDLIFKATRKQDALCLKRKIEDAEVHSDRVIGNSARSPVNHVKKKEKSSKSVLVGQASLLSYFTK
ncbi:abasic site processing protein HMCES isoform X2 [Oryza brachyantha]|uniref:abasic site processing protein HMCES isoform X2 n=1 Tax=Oryza brachyantha TaxID=4533 RepID=UPI0007760B5A|nr:abasic site processing protein HMCES isoform X2 [Oryza brachyantha]